MTFGRIYGIISIDILSALCIFMCAEELSMIQNIIKEGKIMKKLFLVILAIVLVFAPLLSINAGNGFIFDAAASQIEYVSMSLGTFTDSINAEKYYYYTYTPEIDGWYIMWSDDFPGCGISFRDPEEDYYESDAHTSGYTGFSETHYLKAGLSYEYRIHCHEDTEFTYTLKKCIDATDIFVYVKAYYAGGLGYEEVEVKSLKGNPGDVCELEYRLLPLDAVQEEISVVSSDDSVVSVINQSRYVQYNKPGKAVLTISTESGITKTINVEVESIIPDDSRVLKMGERVEVAASETDPEWFRFIACKDSLWISSGTIYATCLTVYDSYGFPIYYDDTEVRFDENGNKMVDTLFSFVPGETYYIKMSVDGRVAVGDKDSHTLVCVNATAPEIGMPGYTGDSICEVCGDIIVVGEEIPALNDENSPETECDHMCHKTGFMGFIWKIINFFGKIFGTNPICECGIAHY